jgi:hypothetical protein
MLLKKENKLVYLDILCDCIVEKENVKKEKQMDNA